jgi:hypothetical protein
MVMYVCPDCCAMASTVWQLDGLIVTVLWAGEVPQHTQPSGSTSWRPSFCAIASVDIWYSMPVAWRLHLGSR